MSQVPETTLPAFVIGGVNASTLGEAVAAGARRIAVSQAVAQSETPRAAAMQLRLLLSGSPSHWMGGDCLPREPPVKPSD